MKNKPQNASARIPAANISSFKFVIISPSFDNRTLMVVVLNGGTIRRTRADVESDTHHNCTRYGVILYGVLNRA